MACATGSWQAGQTASPRSHTCDAQSRQNRLCPQGTRAASTSRSAHTTQSRRAASAVGDTDAAGDGREYDQMLDGAVSKDGESPRPSSRSAAPPPPQMDTRSPRRPPTPPPPLDELVDELELEHDEKAPELEPELAAAAAEKPRDVWSAPSRYGNSDPRPDLYNDASRSAGSSPPTPPAPPPTPTPPAPPPVRMAMCASISRRAVSTLSGRPVTSNTGSLSRDGVTMYVCVWCWMRLMVAPLGPTTRPTTRYGTRTWMVTWPGTAAGGPGGAEPDPPPPPPPRLLFLEARICEKCSAADKISRLALATSSLRPVTTNTGSSPRTGVLMYVFVLARNALILQPATNKKSATSDESGRCPRFALQNSANHNSLHLGACLSTRRRSHLCSPEQSLPNKPNQLSAANTRCTAHEGLASY